MIGRYQSIRGSASNKRSVLVCKHNKASHHRQIHVNRSTPRHSNMLCSHPPLLQQLSSMARRHMLAAATASSSNQAEKQNIRAAAAAARVAVRRHARVIEVIPAPICHAAPLRRVVPATQAPRVLRNRQQLILRRAAAPASASAIHSSLQRLLIAVRRQIQCMLRIQLHRRLVLRVG